MSNYIISSIYNVIRADYDAIRADYNYIRAVLYKDGTNYGLISKFLYYSLFRDEGLVIRNFRSIFRLLYSKCR